jgi:hypothetical protein
MGLFPGNIGIDVFLKNISPGVGVSCRSVVSQSNNPENHMKKQSAALLALILVATISTNSFAQDEIRTVFKGPNKVTAYGALTNKFTKIDDQYVNLAGVYGGVYLNRRVFIGIGGAASTNDVPVPSQFSAVPGRDLSYQYVQFGLVTEVVMGSNRTIHPVFHLFAGPGLTVQYDRHDWEEWENWEEDKSNRDENWFMVAEPGVQLEINLFKWMRFSPGVSYRLAYGQESAGLSDSKLGGTTFNVTLKFGKF